ncbi:unnamed protein product [Penicillium roqueforti FM164]|uniref:Genomic scaffold, ProqFM164S01 n=1 Tax=Penicillium roqueforti (strain FM164) TaxID=1365484 RepID=W6Q067_PENRF|nr:unnamed protein product [Penicillium roqueforti FM164]
MDCWFWIKELYDSDSAIQTADALMDLPIGSRNFVGVTHYGHIDGLLILDQESLTTL